MTDSFILAIAIIAAVSFGSSIALARLDRHTATRSVAFFFAAFAIPIGLGIAYAIGEHVLAGGSPLDVISADGTSGFIVGSGMVIGGLGILTGPTAYLATRARRR